MTYILTNNHKICPIDDIKTFYELLNITPLAKYGLPHVQAFDHYNKIIEQRTGVRAKISERIAFDHGFYDIPPHNEEHMHFYIFGTLYSNREFYDFKNIYANYSLTNNPISILILCLVDDVEFIQVRSLDYRRFASRIFQIRDLIHRGPMKYHIENRHNKAVEYMKKISDIPDNPWNIDLIEGTVGNNIIQYDSIFRFINSLDYPLIYDNIFDNDEFIKIPDIIETLPAELKTFNGDLITNIRWSDYNEQKFAHLQKIVFHIYNFNLDMKLYKNIIDKFRFDTRLYICLFIRTVYCASTNYSFIKYMSTVKKSPKIELKSTEKP